MERERQIGIKKRKKMGSSQSEQSLEMILKKESMQRVLRNCYVRKPILDMNRDIIGIKIIFQEMMKKAKN